MGLQKYTVQEAQNAALGQAGSILVTGTSEVTCKSGVFIAITFLSEVTFDSSGGLIAEDSSRWANTEAAASAGGSGGLQIDVSNTFPKGVTIFGRWTEIDLNSTGIIIAYIG